ncbi:MAG: hypothetical protein R3362_00470 [Rhodothermales bacterium]|nr:hypothetical protein [Rhodothermales bacterium]
MTGLRLLALLTAAAAVLFLGHALYVFVQYGWPATVSMALGALCAVAAFVLHRRARFSS